MGRLFLTAAMLAAIVCATLFPCNAEALTVRVSGYLPIGFTIGGVAVMVSLVFGEASMQAKEEKAPNPLAEPPEGAVAMNFPACYRGFEPEDGITILRW